MCRDGELAWFRTRGPHGHIRVLAESVEKFRQEFCAEAAVLLRAVKIAWRNPTMHVENVYDEEKALDVLNSVKGFMRHLATRLSESKEMLERGSQ